MTRGFAQGAGGGGRVRLRTLSNLRWLAIVGQSVALFLVYFALGYPLPIFYCALAIAVSAALWNSERSSSTTAMMLTPKAPPN